MSTTTSTILLAEEHDATRAFLAVVLGRSAGVSHVRGPVARAPY
jgi:hypothetical protein